MEKLNPLVVDVDKVKPLSFGECYDSRMILDNDSRMYYVKKVQAQ